MGEMLDNLEHLLGDFAGEADPVHGLPRTLKKLHADAKGCTEFFRSFEVLSEPREFPISSLRADYTSSPKKTRHDKRPTTAWQRVAGRLIFGRMGGCPLTLVSWDPRIPYGSVKTSAPLIDPMARQISSPMVSLTKRTEASQRVTCTPPGWRLRAATDSLAPFTGTQGWFRRG
jgi:hypothetical protein